MMSLHSLCVVLLLATPLVTHALETLLDLTYDFFEESTIYWPTSTPFSVTDEYAGDDFGFWYAERSFCTAEHGGTHLDSPIHFNQHGYTTEQIPLERLYGNAALVDVSQHIQSAGDTITAAMLRQWQATHRRIRAGDIVLLYTGWSRFWPDAEQYLGTALRGPDAIPLLNFPGLSPSGAGWLAAQQVGAVGIDTASMDPGVSEDYQAHQILTAENIPCFENVALDARKAHLLERRPSKVVALPMKLKGGSGAPLRMIAIVSGRRHGRH